MANQSNGGSGCGCLALVAGVVAIVGGTILTVVLQSGPSAEERRAETVQSANAIAESKQQADQDRRSGIRSDERAISSQAGPENSATCIDGEGDEKRLDIDRAELSIDGDRLVADVSTFPITLGKGSVIVGELQLTSTIDPDIWVSYSTGNTLGGQRIGTDAKGDQELGPLFITVEGDQQFRLSVPLDDISELGNSFSWQVGLGTQTGLRDRCPNDARTLSTSLDRLR